MRVNPCKRLSFLSPSFELYVSGIITTASNTWNVSTHILILEAHQYLRVSYFHSFQFQLGKRPPNCSHFRVVMWYSFCWSSKAPNELDMPLMQSFSTSVPFCQKVSALTERISSVNRASPCSKILDLLRLTIHSIVLYLSTCWKSSYLPDEIFFLSPPLEVESFPLGSYQFASQNLNCFLLLSELLNGTSFAFYSRLFLHK